MIEFADSGLVDERFPYYTLPDGVTFIATDECNAVCIRPDGTICEFDCDEEGRVACDCARSQESLVAVLTELEEHFARCGSDDSYCDDMDAASRVGNRCVELAGGEKYRVFFTSLLGI